MKISMPRNNPLKENYFTAQTIDAKAREMLRPLKTNRRAGTLSFVPERSALLVLDMQSYFLDPSSHAFVPSAEAVLPRVVSLANLYHAKDLPVVYTRHVNSPTDAHQMASWWQDLITRDNPLSRITPEFNPALGYIIEKSQYDAFHNTDLEEFLHSHKISQVVISGVMTHLCCETTARSAFMRGFEVFFLVDGTATYNELFHKASLINLSHGFAAMKLVAEIRASLQGTSHA
jgi:isochorismate hydrolase